MNTTTNILSHIDYHTLCRYAKTCCRQKRLPEHVAQDIAHSAWIECQRRGRSVVAKENPGALARKIMFTSIQNCIKHLKAQYRHEAPTLPELKGEAPFSDYGSEAERIFLAADSWENPFWLRLFEVVRKEIARDARQKTEPAILPRIVSALMKDSRPAVARESLGVSRSWFGEAMMRLRKRFALCYEALLFYRSTRGDHTLQMNPA